MLMILEELNCLYDYEDGFNNCQGYSSNQPSNTCMPSWVSSSFTWRDQCRGHDFWKLVNDEVDEQLGAIYGN